MEVGVGLNSILMSLSNVEWLSRAWLINSRRRIHATLVLQRCTTTSSCLWLYLSSCVTDIPNIRLTMVGFYRLEFEFYHIWWIHCGSLRKNLGAQGVTCSWRWSSLTYAHVHDFFLARDDFVHIFFCKNRANLIDFAVWNGLSEEVFLCTMCACDLFDKIALIDKLLAFSLIEHW